MMTSPNYLWGEDMLYVFALIAAYFALLIVLSVIARPYRVRLAELANELLADYPDEPIIVELCRVYTLSAYSIRAAPIRLLTYLIILIKPARDIDRECEEMKRDNKAFFEDARITEMMDCYNASISAVSPVFGALAFLASLAFKLKAYIHFHGRDHFEASIAEFVEIRAAT